MYNSITYTLNEYPYLYTGLYTTYMSHLSV